MKRHASSNPFGVLVFVMRKFISFQLIPYLKLLALTLSYPGWMLFSPYKRRRFLKFAKLAWNDLPVVSLDELFPEEISDDTSVRLKALQQKPHNCSTTELLILAISAKLINARKAYEIGTYDGRSTLAIACNIADQGIVHTLNLPDDYFDRHPSDQHRVDIQLSAKVKSGHRFLSQPEASSIVQMWGNSLEFTPVDEAPYDLIFIDGGHGYTEVKHDTIQALKLINKDNGIIIWHDATSYGVGQWLPEFRSQRPEVVRIDGTDVAVLRFIHGRPLSFRSAC
ncbi:MAG: class I SAM-dependent methyltransferase [Synechococcaceae cyanobacterium]|nr:class I SAM-dependent methyltransferase [Synechococcaceae cyanobacterium]